jgi:hypothetical protein
MQDYQSKYLRLFVFCGYMKGRRIMRFFYVWVKVLLSVIVVLLPAGCSLLKKKPPQNVDYSQISTAELTPEEAQSLLGDLSGNWLYGHGLGNTAIQAGTAVAFPPYLVVLLGNSVLSLTGYEPIGVSDFLPEEHKDQWDKFYDTVSSGPGRVTAAIAGTKFRTEEIIRDNIRKYVKNVENSPTF